MTRITNIGQTLADAGFEFYNYESESAKDPVARITLRAGKNVPTTYHGNNFHTNLQTAKKSHILLKDWIEEHGIVDFGLITNNLWLYESADLTNFLYTFKYQDPPNICDVKTFIANITDIDIPGTKQ